jgi:phosphate-selective porin OprO/OprP
MSLRVSFAGVVALWLLLGAAVAQAQNPPDLAVLQRKLEEQEQRIRVLERKLEIQQESAKAAAAAVPRPASPPAAAAAPVVKAGPAGFSLQSADGENVVRLRGLVQFDGRYFGDSGTPPTSNTWLLRRVRPIIEGTLDKIYDFRIMPDFGGGRAIVQDAFVAARFRPWTQVTGGKFKVPVGLERLQSVSDIRFIERAFPTSLVPNRDIGLQLGGDVHGSVLNYSFGYFNGVLDGVSSDGFANPDVQNAPRGDWAARIFLQPFLKSDNFALRGLGFGVAGTRTSFTGSPSTPLLPGYRTPGQQTFFSYRGNTAATSTTPAINNATFADGERLRWTPQFYYYLGQFGALGEYVKETQDVTRVNGATTRSASLDNSAWQLQLSWLVTGEQESYKGVTPINPFEIGQPGWGALELVARYHALLIDSAAFTGGANSFANPATSARRATAAGVGVNWYINKNVKFALDYERTRFDGGAAGGADREDENALLTRLQLNF